MNVGPRRRWLAVCGAVLALVFSACAFAQTQTAADRNDGPLGESVVSWEAEQLWARERYEELDQMFSRLANPAERLTDGRWRSATAARFIPGGSTYRKRRAARRYPSRSPPRSRAPCPRYWPRRSTRST